ncbi:hypothetical protein OAG62_00560, partial [bacterium]|nr:hypothetical protein [bacterium]
PADEEDEDSLPPMLPGDGFDGETEVPPLAGDASAFGAEFTPIARWTSVPWAELLPEYPIGLLAFHVSGIDRVEFAAEGGDWITVSEVRVNPRTDVEEYWASLQAPEDATGTIEVRAKIFPNHGVPRVLTLVVNAPVLESERNVAYVSPSGSDEAGIGTRESPFRTISRAGSHLSTIGEGGLADQAAIRLEAGSYKYQRTQNSHLTSTDNGWLTIEPAEGVDPSECLIVDSDPGVNGGIRTKMVHLRRLTLIGELKSNSNPEDYLWIDGCVLPGGGPGSNANWLGGWWTSIYVTDSSAFDHVNALAWVTLARNCLVERLHQDAFAGGQCIVNCEVIDQIGGSHPDTGNIYHSDLWQERAPATDFDVIVFGLDASQNCTKQGFFSRSVLHRNIAFVNNRLELKGYPEQNTMATRCEHLLVLDNTFTGTPFRLRFSDPVEDVSGYLDSEGALWKGNIFQWIGINDPEDILGGQIPSFSSESEGTIFLGNHYINLWPDYMGGGGTPYGTTTLGVDFTTGNEIPGDVGWRDIWSPR